MTESPDEHFMRVAIAEARKGTGHTSPNPIVGAVLVARGGVVALGHHQKVGSAHAEVRCLESYGRRLRKSDSVYVTLEPCSTTGRTPPCTEAILASGLGCVVVGTIDPNPKHQGRGIATLRAAGIEVRVGVLADECTKLNEAFNKWVQTGRPLVIAKCGMTLDGRLTRGPGEDQWITGPAARRHANRFRAQVDAILIGAETLRIDNPRLTVRENPGGRQPWRVVLSRSGKLPGNAHVFTDRYANRTLLFENKPLDVVLDSLGQKDVTSVLIEGGGEVLGQALDQRLVNQVHIYLGAIFSGGPVIAFPGTGAPSTPEGLRLCDLRYEQIGDDVFISAKARSHPPRLQ
ncbi:MAG: bifunctional diaminohydroxyphosphoribosylaminopyrimidine deaminase/5-amino-6-(5-phosphoribosylamino)uracil reductase RibD [Chthoniobacterales bacterium]|nr:bifunctional diaminohydroxyphosphoribosylaminopyrimidine deaminase/5-amino-6-(5-phosphoribosylamino)uracil reductase RibD [Chthoniobacterales bacterium]